MSRPGRIDLSRRVAALRRTSVDHKRASLSGLLSRDGCAVASESALGGLREESSRLDRLPVATTGVQLTRRHSGVEWS